MTETRTCTNCGCHLVSHRADAKFCSKECRNADGNRRRRNAPTDKRLAPVSGTEGQPSGDVHALAEVRSAQAAKKHNRDLGGLIRQAIVDRLKTVGECHADDLIELYPVGEVAECRRLATAQFGSLAASGLTREKGRRKSSIPDRKGAKSSVWEFTKAGWDRYGTSGSSADAPSRGREVGPNRALARVSAGSGGDVGVGAGSPSSCADPGGSSPGEGASPRGATPEPGEPAARLPEGDGTLELLAPVDPESWAA